MSMEKLGIGFASAFVNASLCGEKPKFKIIRYGKKNLSDYGIGCESGLCPKKKVIDFTPVKNLNVATKQGRDKILFECKKQGFKTIKKITAVFAPFYFGDAMCSEKSVCVMVEGCK